jgi:hypothetical protein
VRNVSVGVSWGRVSLDGSDGAVADGAWDVQSAGNSKTRSRAKVYHVILVHLHKLPSPGALQLMRMKLRILGLAFICILRQEQVFFFEKVSRFNFQRTTRSKYGCMQIHTYIHLDCTNTPLITPLTPCYVTPLEPYLSVKKR